VLVKEVDPGWFRIKQPSSLSLIRSLFTFLVLAVFPVYLWFIHPSSEPLSVWMHSLLVVNLCVAILATFVITKDAILTVDINPEAWKIRRGLFGSRRTFQVEEIPPRPVELKIQKSGGYKFLYLVEVESGKKVYLTYLRSEKSFVELQKWLERKILDF
jgi:hypothetical protein